MHDIFPSSVPSLAPAPSIYDMTSPTPLRRLTLLDLPTETKAYIVKLAWEQDRNFWERTRSRKVPRGDWRGRSLNALYLLNREFSGLAAVHLFRVSNS